MHLKGYFCATITLKDFYILLYFGEASQSIFLIITSLNLVFALMFGRVGKQPI